jgi:lactate dehydrogenase-like 2-hydroxyacid dehydrogenase
MNGKRLRILVITPVSHIPGVVERLERAGEVCYLDDPDVDEVLANILDATAIFTNPNKSNVFIDRAIVDLAPNLRIICTASTGTNHIDIPYAESKGIRVISLTEERATINRITSTAEHAFALLMASLRRVPQGHSSVMSDEWDYTKFIGRQLNQLTVGVVGYGRLGSLFAGYCHAFGARVLVNDPYKDVRERGLEQVDKERILSESDVLSLHVHVTKETINMVDSTWFAQMKPTINLINTARGDIIDEIAAVDFLTRNPEARMAVDVLANEIRGKSKSPLIAFARTDDRLIITPHVGGMTIDGQTLAYCRAADLLAEFFQAF